MEPMIELRVSKVAPYVEGNINNVVQLVDMVKMCGRQGDLTESMNRRMVGYLGNLDEMRQQIVIMVQRYEDDSKVLKRLLELLDRIDDVKSLAIASEYSSPSSSSSPSLPTDSPSLINASDHDLAVRYDTPFNPLMVSTLNILDVSGLFADNIREEDIQEEEEEEGEGDDYWDHEIDHSALAPPDDAPRDVSSINLSVSNLHLPDLFSSTPLPSSSSLLSPIISSQPSSHSAPSSPFPAQEDKKGKGKSKLSQSFSLLESDMAITNLWESGRPSGSNGNGREKGKGKGKGKEKATVQFESTSSDSSEEDDDDAPNGASPWKRAIPGTGFKLSSSSSSSRTTPSKAETFVSNSSSESESESETSSSDGDGPSTRRIPVPPPLPSTKPPKKYSRKKGPCDPVLCKICYDEYSMHEHVYEIFACKHVYCNECLNDYLATNINEGAVLDLVCPFPNCTTEILPTDIKALCSGETIAKYERFTVLAALRADPNARWCPNPFCNNGIKHNEATMPWVYCNACKFEFCFHCMAERHDGVACGEEALKYLQKKKESEEAALEEFSKWTGAMESYVKPCPGCKAFIEKNDGCNHMTCGNPTCRTQFCWLCLNLYTGDHFQDDANFPNCYDKQYYTPYDLPPRPTTAMPPIRRRRFANVAKKVGMYVGVGVAVVTLGVPAAVIGGPVYGCFQLHKRLKARRRASRPVQYRDNENWEPPSPARIAEAAREARRLYALEHS